MDNLTASQRSKTMKSIKSKNTAAELAVRRLCRELGEPGYRLHRRDILGSPDVAYLGRRLAIFVHGCFWHGHTCKAGKKVAQTNAIYWSQKIERNIARDSHNVVALKEKGWLTLTLWECELKSPELVRRELAGFLQRR